MAVGAWVGALAADDRRRPAVVLGAAAGAVGAAAASWLGATARRALPARTGTPDALWAVAEDTAAIALGTAAVRSR
jgi:uncharacterized membrane protein